MPHRPRRRVEIAGIGRGPAASRLQRDRENSDEGTMVSLIRRRERDQEIRARVACAFFFNGSHGRCAFTYRGVPLRTLVGGVMGYFRAGEAAVRTIGTESAERE